VEVGLVSSTMLTKKLGISLDIESVSGHERVGWLDRRSLHKKNRHPIPPRNLSVAIERTAMVAVPRGPPPIQEQEFCIGHWREEKFVSPETDRQISWS
jgi:hypothetical protein